jgi:aerobic carbon-monoxide dehydrogenase small subunit
MPKKAAKKAKPARKKPAKVLKAESGAKPPQSVETPIAKVTIRLTANGKQHELNVEPRLLLVELLREQLDLTGTHVGCDTTYCGACTVLMNGAAVKSCTMFAVQADGAELLTVEGLAKDGELHPIQKAFGESYGLQCGYCTPGLMLSTYQLLSQNAKPSEKEIRKAIAGNTCRCTGYQNIFKAIQLAAQGGKGA